MTTEAPEAATVGNHIEATVTALFMPRCAVCEAPHPAAARSPSVVLPDDVCAGCGTPSSQCRELEIQDITIGGGDSLHLVGPESTE